MRPKRSASHVRQFRTLALGFKQSHATIACATVTQFGHCGFGGAQLDSVMGPCSPRMPSSDLTGGGGGAVGDNHVTRGTK